jgi:hypothetical protein
MPLAERSNCRLDLDGRAWLFTGNECINGIAHGTGLAASLDGAYVIRDGRFVLGHIIAGERESLILRPE